MYITFECKYRGNDVVLELKGTADDFLPVSGYVCDDNQTELTDSQIETIIEQNLHNICQEFYVADMDANEHFATQDADRWNDEFWANNENE